MQLSHRFAADSAVFDEDNIVSSAGLVPVMALPEQTALSRVPAEKVCIRAPRIATGIEPVGAPLTLGSDAAAKLEVDPRVTESSDTSDTPAQPQDYASLRAELGTLVGDFSPLINELWPRLEDHKFRWELHSYGFPEGYDGQVVTDVIALLIEALKGIGIADKKLLQAHTKADHHNPSSPDAA